MTFGRLVLRSVIFYRRTHVAVALGVACAVAVLTGALLVGGSVRASLATIATTRLGRTDFVLTAERPFGEGLISAVPSVPLFVLTGTAVHESSSRRASDIQVYGVDRRFFAFHKVTADAPAGSEVLLSPDLAVELRAASGDTILVRATRPTDIPLDSLQGRKEDASRTMRLRSRGTLDRSSMGEFALAPTQGPVRAVFVALSTLRRELEQPSQANALLVSASPGTTTLTEMRARVSSALTAEDLGLRFAVDATDSTIVIESTAGLIPDAVASAIEAAAAGESLQITPVLTWLANRMTVSGRSVPYSLVTALGPAEFAGLDEVAGQHLMDARGARLPLVRRGPTPGALGSRLPLAAVPRLADSLGPAAAGAARPPIILNDWAMRDLHAAPGDLLDLEYFRWADEGRLVTEHESFQVAGGVPMEGLALDRRLAPDYPGITNTNSFSDWNPPFPIDLGLVRPADEDYWRRFRTTPKAFMPLAVGQRLWRTRHGQVTSLRLRAANQSPLASGDRRDLADARRAKAGSSGASGADLEATAARLRVGIPHAVDPFRAGFNAIDVRAQSTTASAGATDFAVYFASFSVFLMVSALLLVALFFRLGVEQRLRQIGVLRAAGYSLGAVRWLFLREGLVMAAMGASLGIVLAVGWAALMMYGLRTWWVDAVGTTHLQLHVEAGTLTYGWLGGLAVAAVSITITIRGLSSRSPRALLTGATDLSVSSASRGAVRIAAGSLAAAAALTALAIAAIVPPAAGFFGAGTLVLVGGLAGFRAWLGRRRTRMASIVALGLRNASWRPGRSMTAAGLVAAAVFLLVSVDAFRKGAGAEGAESGTGGFALLAESAVPIVRDPSTPEGREALGLSLGQELRGVELIAARLRPGDDTSCLNLYQPTRPRIVGLPDRFITDGRFAFSHSIATTGPERLNPWRLLLAPADDGVVPAIADATSLEYVLHASVGDVISIDSDTSHPQRLRIVAELRDSVLQGELLISERHFLTIFPDTVGYRVLFVETGPASSQRIDQVARVLEERLEPFGLDAQKTGTRLAAFHRVENTYLSTFQALGGLGLLLGTFGLAAVISRNVLERRRELAWLRAAGFTGRQLQLLVIAENVTLVIAGMAIGIAAAFVAIAPVLLTHAGGPPRLPLIWLAAVLVTALLSAPWAAGQVRRLRLVESLRGE